jgi:hypothetical protein
VTVLVCGLSANQLPAADKKDDKAQASASQKDAPKIQFAEQSHDFGEALQNGSLKHTFAFKNVGKGLLIIEDVKAG